MVNEELQTANIKLEPVDESEYRRVMKGGVNFHRVYNQFYKGARVHHNLLDELFAAPDLQEKIKEMSDQQKEAYYKELKLWRGDTYIRIFRDEDRPSKILARKIKFEKPEPTREDPNPEYYKLEPLENLDPLSHVNDVLPFIELETPQPIKFALAGLTWNTICTLKNKDGELIFKNMEEITNAPNHRKIRWVSKIYFFRLIKVQKKFWEKYFAILNPFIHDLTVYKAQKKYQKKNYSI